MGRGKTRHRDLVDAFLGSRQQRAGSGKIPPVRPFATHIRSGRTPAFLHAKIEPTRPKPVSTLSVAGITIDFDTIGENGPDLEGTVTVRERDAMTQERIKIDDLLGYLLQRVS